MTEETTGLVDEVRAMARNMGKNVAYMAAEATNKGLHMPRCDAEFELLFSLGCPQANEEFVEGIADGLCSTHFYPAFSRNTIFPVYNLYGSSAQIRPCYPKISAVIQARFTLNKEFPFLSERISPPLVSLLDDHPQIWQSLVSLRDILRQKINYPVFKAVASSQLIASYHNAEEKAILYGAEIDTVATYGDRIPFREYLSSTWVSELNTTHRQIAIKLLNKEIGQ